MQFGKEEEIEVTRDIAGVQVTETYRLVPQIALVRTECVVDGTQTKLGDFFIGNFTTRKQIDEFLNIVTDNAHSNGQG